MNLLTRLTIIGISLTVSLLLKISAAIRLLAVLLHGVNLWILGEDRVREMLK